MEDIKVVDLCTGASFITHDTFGMFIFMFLDAKVGDYRKVYTHMYLWSLALKNNSQVFSEIYSNTFMHQGIDGETSW